MSTTICGRALDLRFQHRQFLLRILRACQHGLGHDGLAHGGGRLGQRHRRPLLQLGLAGGEGALVVEAVPQLVRQRADLVERAVEVAQDAAFFHARDAHAERPAALAVALLGVDPAIVEGALGKGPQIGRELPEVLQDEIAGLFEGVDLVALPTGAKMSHQASFSLPSFLALALK